MIKRIIFDLFFLITIFLGPWWLATALGIVFTFIFKNYWEVLFAGIFMDALYYVPSNELWGNFGLFTLSSLVIIIIIEKLRKQIRV